MNCTHCNKKIVLVPSARERAAKFGGTPASYTKLFTMHARCQLERRAASELITTYTLSAEHSNGAFLELKANGLTNFIVQALSYGIDINDIVLLPAPYLVYKCTVAGVFYSGTKKLMAHFIEVV
jgi:hypothetical protein